MLLNLKHFGENYGNNVEWKGVNSRLYCQESPLHPLPCTLLSFLPSLSSQSRLIHRLHADRVNSPHSCVKQLFHYFLQAGVRGERLPCVLQGGRSSCLLGASTSLPPRRRHGRCEHTAARLSLSARDATAVFLLQDRQTNGVFSWLQDTPAVL